MPSLQVPGEPAGPTPPATAGYLSEYLTREEDSRQRALYSPFTDALRDLIDASIRTTVSAEEILSVQGQIEEVTARLRASQLDGSYGEFDGDLRGRHGGNAVVGLRNPMAPPLVMTYSASEPGRVDAELSLGAAYEGAPGHVHGGVAAMVLDQMLSEAAQAGGRTGMTGTLTLRYRCPTPLGELRAAAWIDGVEGYKTRVTGHLIGPEGVTVEASGMFLLPRWAREALESGLTPWQREEGP